MWKERKTFIEGLTLLEIIMATTIMTVGILGVMSAIVSARNLDQKSSDYIRVSGAIQQRMEVLRQEILEKLKNGDIDEILLPPLPNGEPAPNGLVGGYEVPGVRWTNDLPMEVIIINQENHPALGSDPIDLNGNGVIDTEAIDQNEIRMFPVRVKVNYLNSVGREESISMGMIVAPQTLK